MSNSERPHRWQPTRLPSLGFSRQEYWSGLPFPSPVHESEKWKWSHSVVSDSLRPHGLQLTRLLRPWYFPGKCTGVGCHCLFRKKAEYPIIDAFELWCWKRLLRVPWTARISDQSIPKEISPECSLEGLMLKLKLQYFGHLMQRADSFEKILIPGKIEVRRRRGWEDEMVGWHHWLSGHELE